MKSIESLLLAVATLGGLSIVVNPALAQNWTPTSAPDKYWNRVVSSADGNKLAAFSYLQVYTSTNAGTSWISNSLPSCATACAAAAGSADGLILVAGDVCGWIYTSTNAGATWITNNVPTASWSSVASSADGSKLVAAKYPGPIYTWQYRPTLCVSSSNTNLVVSWASSPFAAGYVLQQNNDLAPANWTTVGSPVNDDGTNISVTISPLIGNSYFRLF